MLLPSAVCEMARSKTVWVFCCELNCHWSFEQSRRSCLEWCCVWPIFAWDFPWTWRPGGLKNSTFPTTAQKIIHPRRSCYNSQTRSRQAAIWPRHVWGFNKGCLYIPESVGKTWKDNLEVPQRQNINELPPKRIRNRMKYSWVCVCYIFIFIYLFSMKFGRRWYWQWVPAGDLQESPPQLLAILYLVLRKHSSLLPLLGHENEKKGQFDQNHSRPFQTLLQTMSNTSKIIKTHKVLTLVPGRVCQAQLSPNRLPWATLLWAKWQESQRKHMENLWKKGGFLTVFS